MIYVIQRNDSKVFEPSDADPIYKEAFYEAVDAGVEIYPCKYLWDLENAICRFKHAYHTKPNLQIELCRTCEYISIFQQTFLNLLF